MAAPFTEPGDQAEGASTPSRLTARLAWAFLAGYFLLQAFLRVAISDTVELDESEQVLCAQVWRWGYGSSPPLYTWLQILAFQVFGSNVLALALLKNAILFAAFAFTYLAAKEMTGDERLSVVAMLSLLFFPQITWESQRDLTHSVLATALAAATFYSALRVARKGHWLEYLGLGVWVALGTLTKSSYCLLALALAAAALSVPSQRRWLLRPGIFVSLAAFVLLTAFYFQWIWLSPEAALRRSEEIVRSNSGAWLTTRLKGATSIPECALMLGGVLGAVYWWTFFRGSPARGPRRPDDGQTWLERTFLIVLFISVGVVIGFGIGLRDRWFQPLVFLGAIWAALQIRERLTLAAEQRFRRAVVAVAALAVVILPSVPLAASITRRPTRLNAPYASLGRELKAAAGMPGVILASTRWVGGNLKLHFPSSRVLVPEFHALPVSTNVPWLVVWDATKSPAPTLALSNLVARLRALRIDQYEPAFVDAEYKYTSGKKMRLGYIRLPDPP